MIESMQRCLRSPLLWGLAMAVAAAGCGGGGGGSSSAPAPSSPAPAANQVPDARFTVSDSDGFAPLTVTFDASAAVDPDGTITAFDWDFGDDATGTGATVSHTFRDTGTFTVTLTVTDDDGATDAVSRNLRSRGAAVSGTIRIGAGSAVDSDVNDSFTTPVGNNDFGTAQPVDDPLRLGGFVNVAGTGADDGNFRNSGDPDDYFFVTLEGDERIVLSIAEPDADLDLELYSDDPTPSMLDASMSATDLTEDLPVPAPGNYFIRVTALAGASNYVLSIDRDSALSPGVRRAKRLSDPFVPGEVLLATTREPVERFALAAGTDRGDLQLRRESPGFERLETLDVQPRGAAPGATMTQQTRQRFNTLLAMRAAHQRPDVRLAELNVLRRTLVMPNDEFYEAQWHYPEIGLEQAWELTTGREPGNPEVVVAVVDTGVLLEHPDLRNQLLRDASGNVVGFDFIQDPARANDGDGIDPDPNDPGDEASGTGTGSYHGTHVAGTIAAESDNGIGVAGVSWGARLMPLRALGIDGGTTFDVLQAMRFAAGLSNTSGTVPPVAADVINLSLGSDFFSEAEQQTIDEIRARGIFVVASAGNNSSDVPSYPAAYNGVISVAASTIRSDLTGNPADYSNFGASVDLAAPGGQFGSDDNLDGRQDLVASTIGSGAGGSVAFEYGLLQGTSMAAPHVSGVLALMKALYPGLSPAEFDALLLDGELTDTPPGWDDRYGIGIINALDAVQAANLAQGGNQATFLLVSEGQLDFQSFTTSLEFEISKRGDDPVTVTVSDDEPWLNVVPESVGIDGLGTYTATVERAGLADGRYVATIAIQSSNPDVSNRSIQVIMRVASPDIDADAGQHYVILVPPDAEESEVAQIVRAANGEYTFRLTDVAPGQYRLFAGTDHDNDAFICDGGEACGAYPTLSDPTIISVDARQEPELTGQSFSSEYRTTATTTAADTDRADRADPDRADAGIAVPDKP